MLKYPFRKKEGLLNIKLQDAKACQGLLNGRPVTVEWFNSKTQLFILARFFIYIFSRANQATIVMSNAIAIAVPAATIATDSIVGNPAK